jgi:hypothetical protein
MRDIAIGKKERKRYAMMIDKCRRAKKVYVIVFSFMRYFVTLATTSYLNQHNIRLDGSSKNW